MKQSIVLLFSMLLLFDSYAQGLSTEIGRISRNDAEYQYEDEVDAVVLFDKGSSRFVQGPNGFEINFTRSRRVKIFNKAGLDYAEISIPYYLEGYGKTENVKSIVATTYNFDNGMLSKNELDPSSIYEEKLSDHWTAEKFVFPNAKEGSIIEYQYEIVTPFFSRLPDWEFQESIPVKYSEYVVKIIPFYDYVYWAQGISRFSYKNAELAPGIDRSYGGIDYKEMINTFVMKDVEPFDDESYITTRNDYIKKIYFQLSKVTRTNGVSTDIITTWENLNKELLKHLDFGKYVRKCDKMSKDLLSGELILDNKTELEKAKAITAYVKNAFQWNGSHSIFASKSPKELFNEKTGNTADINLLLVSLFNQANIDCQPVLISTRNHGKINTDYPFYHSFNHVLVLYTIDGKVFITDSTDPQINYNRIPPRCINETGLIVKEGEPEWATLHNNINSIDNKMIQMTIDTASIQAETLLSLQTTEFEAYYYRRNHENDSIQIKDYFKKFNFSEIDKVSTSNYEDIDKPYVITLSGKTDLEMIDGKILISPFLKMPLQSNALKQESRSYPVDLVYNRTESYQVYINTPDNYKVYEMPEDYHLDNTLISIDIEYHQNENNSVVVKGKYELKKAVYQPGEYSHLKDGIDMIVKKFNEQIILERI